jgi:transposase
MKMPLFHDKKNPKCNLLSVIFDKIDSKKTRQELARNGIKPAAKALNYIKVSIIAMFYGLDKSYVVYELNNSSELRKSFGFKSKLDYNQLCEVFSRFSEQQILEFVLKRLNKEFKKEKRTARYILVDATSIQFDINLDKKYYSSEELDEKNFKLGYSSSKGHYIGGKLVIAIDYDTCQPLIALFYPGAVHDSKLFPEILHELKRRRILRYKDTIIADKGFTSYDNYQIALLKYKIVPLIFPKKNMSREKILSKFSYPLEVFKYGKSRKQLYRNLYRRFKALLYHWKDYRSIRSKIEDFFKFMKNGVGYSKIPVYTYKSAAKNTFLNVLLAGLIVAHLTLGNKEIQRLAES